MRTVSGYPQETGLSRSALARHESAVAFALIGTLSFKLVPDCRHEHTSSPCSPEPGKSRVAVHELQQSPRKPGPGMCDGSVVTVLLLGGIVQIGPPLFTQSCHAQESGLTIRKRSALAAVLAQALSHMELELARIGYLHLGRCIQLAADPAAHALR